MSEDFAWALVFTCQYSRENQFLRNIFYWVSVMTTIKDSSIQFAQLAVTCLIRERSAPN